MPELNLNFPKLYHNYTKNELLRVGVDVLTVEAWLGDLVVPQLGGSHHPGLDSGLVLLGRRRLHGNILPHCRPVQFPSLTVVVVGALISPPLSYGLQLLIPDLILGGTMTFLPKQKFGPMCW